MSSFVIMFALCFLTLLGTSYYIHVRRKQLDEMHGMMTGMGLGMMSGLLTATFYLMPTGDFLYGTIIGSIIGLAFGMFFGRHGGHLGIGDGVMAGPMGGMMGAMLGQMIRPFDLDVFVPFFVFIFLISLLSLCYCARCCCKKPEHLSQTFTGIWAVVSVALLLTAIALPFSLADTSNYDLRLPPALQQQEQRARAIVHDGMQVITMTIENSAYSPNILEVAQDIPVRIDVIATKTAGCGSEITIPEFKIKKIVAPNSNGIIEFTPTEKGTFTFSCSMDMAQGKIIVV